MYRALREYIPDHNLMESQCLICRLAHSPNGWTDGELGMLWMVKDFDGQTKEKAGGRTRVLLMDGHSSHYTLELLEYARDNNIVILGYPPHCTHVLQGLDVVCFAKMKEEFRKEIRKFEDSHFASVGKGDFAGIFGHAFLRAFTPDSIRAAFEATGVHPFNPDVITEKQMKPSLPTSTRGTFPLTQPSPVRAILKAMANQPPTSFDLSPTFAQPIAGPSHIVPTTTPSPSRTLRHDIDSPEPDTPSKRMRIMYSELGATSSGSMLVSKTRITSAYKAAPPVIEKAPLLPEPDWTHLDKKMDTGYQSRESLLKQIESLTDSLHRSRDIIRTHQVMAERTSAQLVLQNAHLNKLNQVLHTRENKKQSDRTILFAEGYGRHLTNEESIGLVRGQKERKEREAAELEQRRVARDDRKAAKAALEAEWKDIVRKHEQAVQEWNVECDKLRAEGMRVRELPKKPKRPLKPKLPVEEQRDDDDRSLSSSDEGGG